MFPGGIANKLGNRYERKWAVRKLLEVIEGNAASMQYEGVSEKFHGFEFALHRPELRKRILDVIDEMAAKNIMGADDLVRLDDR